ncbi:hypothetical protein TNCV_1869321 [Trichonephila clavipes]|nr:hypothetical protein TNCV_1869321 [Trichonephila clavipes]
MIGQRFAYDNEVQTSVENCPKTNSGASSPRRSIKPRTAGALVPTYWVTLTILSPRYTKYVRLRVKRWYWEANRVIFNRHLRD